jgi:hypothetical protein
MAEVRIGGTDAEYLSLRSGGRSCPTGSDWDANWLACVVEVAAGEFRGRAGGVIRTEEVEHFRQQLAGLHGRLTGEAVFETLEQWVTVRLTGDGRGHIETRGELRDGLVAGNALRFCLQLDGSYLPHILQQLAAAVKEYPVVRVRNP